jgi:hypothetical protein
MAYSHSLNGSLSNRRGPGNSRTNVPAALFAVRTLTSATCAFLADPICLRRLGTFRRLETSTALRRRRPLD